MPYTPLNVNVYSAAFAGAMAAMCNPTGAAIVDSASANYANFCLVAEAWAQAVDTAWGITPAPNEFDVNCLQSLSAAYHSSHPIAPQASSVFSNPANWTIAARAAVAVVKEGDANFATLGITPPPLAGPTSATSPIEFPNIAAMSSYIVPTILAAGSLGWVDTLKATFEWLPGDTSTPDGITIVAAPAGGAQGRWFRNDVAWSEWATQADWHINATTGNDENSGSNANPLRTFLEFRRRIGENLWVVGGICTIHTNLADDDLFLLDFGTTDDSGVNTIIGVRTTVKTGTLVIFTPRNPAANQQYEFSSPDVPDWTPYIGDNYRIEMTNGNANGYNACIVKNIGIGTGRSGTFALYPIGAGLPTAGDTFRIYSMPIVHKYSITPRRGTFTLQDLYFDVVGTDWVGGTTYFNGYIFSGPALLYTVDCNISLPIFYNNNYLYFWNCFGIGYTLFQSAIGFWTFGAFVTKAFIGVTNTTFDFLSGSAIEMVGGVLFQGAAWFNKDLVYMHCHDAAVFDSPSSGVHMEHSGQGFFGTIYGQSNLSYGIVLDATSYFTRAAGGVQAIAGGGVGTDVSINGTVKTWAQLPYDDRGVTPGSIAAAL